MKQLLLLILLIPSVVFAQKKDSWKICAHHKTVASGTMGGDTEPVTAELSATKGTFKITYKSAAKDKKRSIIIMNESRNPLITEELGKNSGTVKIDINQLKEKTGGKTFYVYTLALPTDPAIAATIRVRPMLLCTVSWKNSN